MMSADRTVFLLQHSYERDDCDETKTIGIYSSRSQAEAAIVRLSQQPGFCERPDDFWIDEYELDRDNWCEGFATIGADE
ncbi:hypothetical protein [Chamaesiphon sp. VAR_69_metabat_338]|uniref:DUF7336 domain-containing protein n=1 Tax=Chamaesiphon sp. VAR_69_metabat_338 TaxID=2964704 RepID=UPI00286E0545|nr:hypothetical protein [Chamaesiphon sp. VAR_69_metabat_338]